MNTEALLKQVADDAAKTAREMLGEDDLNHALIVAIHEAGYQRGRQKGFENGQKVGRSYLTYTGFFAFYMLSMLIIMAVGAGMGMALDYLNCPVPQ